MEQLKTTPPARRIRAAALQWDIRLGDTASNIGQMEEGVARAAEEGVNLLVFPEMWASGFDYTRLAAHALETPKIIGRLRSLALRHRMVLAGSLPSVHASGRIANTLYIMDSSGEVAGAYDKLHLFTPTGEDRHFVAGNAPLVCTTPVGVLGAMICYDLRFPELARHLALCGAEILVVPAQWPIARIHHWDTLLQARAIENQVFAVAANRCGEDPGLKYGGSSRIVSPSGTVLANAGDTPELVIADLDFSERAAIRKAMPCLTHVRSGMYNLSPQAPQA